MTHDGSIAIRCVRCRTDDIDPLFQNVQNMLQWVTSLPTGCIHAVVDSGWITLFGRVHWDYQKQAAVSAVRFVVGATGVTDRVTLDAGAPRLDRCDQETL